MHVQEVRNGRALGAHQLFCEQHANLFWNSYLADSRIGTGSSYRIENAGRFELELIMGEDGKEIHKVLLREVGNNRLVWLPIEYLEVCVLYHAVQESPYNEWTIHVAMTKIVKYLGGELSYVMIDDLHPQGYFIAKAVFVHNSEVIAVPIRPSDGLALSILTRIPFLVTEKVLAKIGETGKFGRV